MDDSDSHPRPIRCFRSFRHIVAALALIALGALFVLLLSPHPAHAEGGSHILVAGDSFAGPVSFELKKYLRATPGVTLKTDYRVASGLAHPDYFDWPAEMEWALANYTPDVVVLLLGTNDTMEMRVGARFFPRGTAAWRAEYASRVGAMMDMVGQAGAQLYWVAPPAMRDGWRNDMINIIDDIIAEQAQPRPWVHYVDTRPLLSDADGAFALYLPDYNGNMVQVRSTDGIHLTWDGSNWVAGFVYRVMTQSGDTSGMGQALADKPPEPTVTPTPPPPPPPPDKHSKKK